MGDCMSIFDWLDSLITDAMKTGDKEMLSLYRLVKSEMVKSQKEKGTFDHLAVYKSMKKKLIEEIAALEQANRDTNTQRKHLAWIEDQLPAAVSKEQIELSIKEYLADYPNANIGQIMGYLKVIYTGQTLDMGLASKMAKDLIGK